MQATPEVLLETYPVPVSVKPLLPIKSVFTSQYVPLLNALDNVMSPLINICDPIVRYYTASLLDCALVTVTDVHPKSSKSVTGFRNAGREEVTCV